MTLYPNPSSVVLSEALLSRGYKHLGKSSDCRWQIECYPHPAIIEIFGLANRLQYKKGTVEQKRQGQVQLAALIKSLQLSEVIRLRVDSQYLSCLEEGNILSLQGRKLKENEDVLDSIVCLYIAALYADNATHRVFGTLADGYIYVPQQICVKKNNVCLDVMSSDEKMKLLIEIAEREAQLELADHPSRNQMGFCHMLWSVQKRILKEKYGIAWRSPAEAHKSILFD